LIILKLTKERFIMSIQKQFIWINIIGGLSVLGGYVYALLDHPVLRGQIWGGVPETWQPWITMFMFFSGFGYCYGMYYLIFNEGLNLKFFGGRYDSSIMRTLVILFLLSASMWIHSTFSYLELPTAKKMGMIQIELWCTALSLLFMTFGLATAKGIKNIKVHKLSVIGLGVISFHCFFLDAILWTSYLPRNY
jgi:hypothetical protein